MGMSRSLQAQRAKLCKGSDQELIVWENFSKLIYCLHHVKHINFHRSKILLSLFTFYTHFWGNTISHFCTMCVIDAFRLSKNAPTDMSCQQESTTFRRQMRRWCITSENYAAITLAYMSRQNQRMATATCGPQLRGKGQQWDKFLFTSVFVEPSKDR